MNFDDLKNEIKKSPLKKVELNKTDSTIITNNNSLKAENRLVKASSITKELTAPEWLIKKIIPSNGMLEIIGASGSYKSFFVLDMMFCVSAGIDYHGIKAKKGVVVYVAGEGVNGTKIRLRGLELHYNIEEYDFYILPMPSNLIDENEIIKLTNEIKQISETISMVMFDTLHRNSAGAKEDSADDWAVILKNMDKYLLQAANIIAWVHHTGISETAGKRGRGTSSRYGSVDTQILVEKTDTAHARIINTKQKDGEEFEPFNLEFEKIETGLLNEDLEPITTLYPKLSNRVEKRVSKLKKEHNDLLGCLRNVIQDNGSPISEELKEREGIEEGRFCLVSEWREEALKLITSNGDTDPKKQREAKIKSFTRFKKLLIDEQMINEYDNFVYIKSDCKFKLNKYLKT